MEHAPSTDRQSETVDRKSRWLWPSVATTMAGLLTALIIREFRPKNKLAQTGIQSEAPKSPISINSLPVGRGDKSPSPGLPPGVHASPPQPSPARGEGILGTAIGALPLSSPAGSLSATDAASLLAPAAEDSCSPSLPSSCGDAAAHAHKPAFNSFPAGSKDWEGSFSGGASSLGTFEARSLSEWDRLWKGLGRLPPRDVDFSSEIGVLIVDYMSDYMAVNKIERQGQNLMVEYHSHGVAPSDPFAPVKISFIAMTTPCQTPPDRIIFKRQ